MNLAMNAAYAMRENGGLLADRRVARRSRTARGADPAGRGAGGLCADIGEGHRHRHERGNNGKDIRPLLHHKRNGRRDRARALRGPRHRGKPRRRLSRSKANWEKEAFSISCSPSSTRLPSPQEEPGDESTGREHGRILLVDDEPDIVEAEKAMLERLGYAVVARREQRRRPEGFRSRAPAVRHHNHRPDDARHDGNGPGKEDHRKKSRRAGHSLHRIQRGRLGGGNSKGRHPGACHEAGLKTGDAGNLAPRPEATGERDSPDGRKKAASLSDGDTDASLPSGTDGRPRYPRIS